MKIRFGSYMQDEYWHFAFGISIFRHDPSHIDIVANAAFWYFEITIGHEPC